MALRLSVRKSEIIKNTDDVHWNVWTNMKKLYMSEILFSKKELQNEILNHLHFGPNFVFLGGTAVKNKKASYGPVYRHFQKHPPEMFYKKAVLFSSILY